MIPVRCFTCNKVMGDKWEQYQEILASGETPSVAFQKLGITRYCCKRILLGHVDLVSKMLQYTQPNDKVQVT